MPETKKMEARIKTQKEIQEKKVRIYLAKKQEVEIYRHEKNQQRKQLLSYREQSEKQNYERKLLIR